MKVIEVKNGDNKVLVSFAKMEFQSDIAINGIFREIIDALSPHFTRDECFNEKEKIFELTFINSEDSKRFILRFLTASEFQVSLSQKPFLQERPCKWDNSKMQSFEYPAVWIEMV